MNQSSWHGSAKQCGFFKNVKNFDDDISNEFVRMHNAICAHQTWFQGWKTRNDDDIIIQGGLINTSLADDKKAQGRDEVEHPLLFTIIIQSKQKKTEMSFWN